jgi:Ser/Thr protein kinase RdoA (MazF antagonist)
MTHKGPLLAEGRTAEIYAWGEDQILKLFRQGWPERSCQYEHRMALASQQTGYRVPAVGDLIEIDGRQGIIYQRVEGRTMLQMMSKRPWKAAYFGRQMAQLHAEMHTHTAEGLPLVVERLTHKIQHAPRLTEGEKQRILTHLDALPVGDKLLHGDFHPDNIMLTNDGPIIIDWIDAAIGHPLADVARTLVIASVGIPPEERILAAFVKFFLRPYLPTYFKHSPYSRGELDTWVLPVAAARMQENIPHEIEPLLKIVRERL